MENGTQKRESVVPDINFPRLLNQLEWKISQDAVQALILLLKEGVNKRSVRQKAQVEVGKVFF